MKIMLKYHIDDSIFNFNMSELNHLMMKVDKNDPAKNSNLNVKLRIM